MSKLTYWPPKRERRAYPNPVFSPPQELGYPGQRTALAVSRSCQGALQKRQGQLRSLAPAGYLPYQRHRWSRLIASWPVFFTAAGGLEQHDQTNYSNPAPVQLPPHLILALGPSACRCELRTARLCR